MTREDTGGSDSENQDPLDHGKRNEIEFGGEIDFDSKKEKAKKRDALRKKPEDYPSFRVPLDEDYF